MKKITILLTLVMSVVLTFAAETTTRQNEMRKALKYYVLKDRLHTRHLNILGLKSGKDSTIKSSTKKPLLGTSSSSESVQPIVVNTDGWIYTITTNDMGQITKYATKGTNTVTFIWNNFIVPMRYRLSFMTLTEEQKMFVMGYVDDLRPWTEKDPIEPFIDPKKVDKKDTDQNTTEEIHEIQARGW